MEEKGNKHHYSEIDYLRVICTLGIFVYHFSFDSQIEPFKSFSDNYGYVLATLCTGCFFVITGYLLYSRYQKIENYTEFIFHRLKTLIPYFWITWIIFAIKILIKNHYFLSTYPIWRIILTVFGVDGYLSLRIPNFYLVGEWFLGAMLIVNLLYPLLVKFCTKKQYIIPIIMCLIVLATLQNNNILPRISIGFQPIAQCLSYTLMGMVINKYSLVFHRKSSTFVALIIFIATLMVQSQFYDTVLLVIRSSVFFIISINIFRKIKNQKANNYIANVAKYTYCFFLVHHIIITFFLRNLTPGNGNMAFFDLFAAFFTSIIFAIVIYNLTNYILKHCCIKKRKLEKNSKG